MAAKQGLSAQLSQAGEDAKRAVLSRTGVTSSWFSNLNTVCTIKSAPPRSPEVLQMLATKSGWLYKRNEQHVWQARWCCVVPHMFLYYFDANIGVDPGDAPNKLQQNPPSEKQEEWNHAVQNGYGNRRQHEKRSSYNLFNQSSSAVAQKPDVAGDTGDQEHEAAAAGTADSTKFATLQPSGIIDLECYTSVHRSTENELVLELAGDDQVNKDLRAFYFCAADEEEGEAWSSALLNDRHPALVDECDAYKQVCDGFAQQLQVLHSDLDHAQMVASEAQDELYRVRSQQEDHRRLTWRTMEEAVLPPSSCQDIESKRTSFRSEIDRVRSQDLGVQAAVQMLLKYTKGLEDAYAALDEAKTRLASDLKESGQSDQAKVADLSSELSAMKTKYEQDKKQWETQVETATSKYIQSQKELQDVKKDLTSTKMEITMFQTQQKNKISELQQHKKILKKEVIELRTKLENANSELGAIKHKHEQTYLQTAQERQKSALLERYVEKIESQVKVQQNMMEMMSASGSVYGGASVGPMGDHSHASGRRGVVYVTQDSQMDGEGEEGETGGLGPISTERRRINTANDDDRSHVSELTEDRTQRHFEVMQRDFQQNSDSNLRSQRSRLQITSPRGPPPLIVGVNTGNRDGEATDKDNPHSETLRGGASAAGLPPRSIKGSTTPTSERKLSVAEKARLNADRGSTPVKVRIDDSMVKAVEEAKRQQENSPFAAITGTSPHNNSNSGGGGESSVVRRVGEALLGRNDVFSDDDDDGTSIYSTRVTDYTEVTQSTNHREDEEKKISETGSVANSTSNLSLAERSEMQRQLQIKFLKERGLVKAGEALKGGAGSSIADDTSSVASSSYSRAKSFTSFSTSRRGNS